MVDAAHAPPPAVRWGSRPGSGGGHGPVTHLVPRGRPEALCWATPRQGDWLPDEPAAGACSRCLDRALRLGIEVPVRLDVPALDTA